jgi:ABC-type branched-subunit amino acid transport system substrate-binding protein
VAATEYAYFWNTLLVAAKAIEVAGSDDPADIARALRSGNVEVDTPFGNMHIQPDGSAGLTQRLGRIENGEVVPLGD